MTPCRRWDIVLVPFPFTDLRESKKRPALILSPDDYNAGPDRIIAFITSRVNAPARPGDCHIAYWRESGLPKPSMVRMKLATIHERIVLKRLGCLPEADRQRIREVLTGFFS